MKHYTYKNYNSKAVVFECDAESITKADALLLQATGIVAAKASHIGCSIN